MSPRSAPALRALVWLALGSWLGVAGLFGGAVAPAAFGATPSLEIAGNFVGRVLPAVNGTGAVVGLLVAGLGWALRRRSRGLLGLALVMTALCTGSELFVSPAIEALRPALHAGSIDPALRPRFGMLHGASVTLFGASVLCGIGLALLSLRADLADLAQKNRVFP